MSLSSKLLISTIFTFVTAHAADERCFKDVQVPAMEGKLAWSHKYSDFGYSPTPPILLPNGTLISSYSATKGDSYLTSVDLIDTKTHTSKTVTIDGSMMAGPIALSDKKSFLIVTEANNPDPTKSNVIGRIYSQDGTLLRTIPELNSPSGVYAQKDGGFAVASYDLSIYRNDGKLIKKVPLSDRADGKPRKFTKSDSRFMQSRDGSFAYIESTFSEDTENRSAPTHKLITLNPDGSPRSQTPIAVDFARSQDSMIRELPNGELATMVRIPHKDPKDDSIYYTPAMGFFDRSGKMKHSAALEDDHYVSRNFTVAADGSLISTFDRSVTSLSPNGDFKLRSSPERLSVEENPPLILPNGNLIARGHNHPVILSPEGELVTTLEPLVADPRFSTVSRYMLGTEPVVLANGEMVFQVQKSDESRSQSPNRNEAGLEFWTLAPSKTKTVTKKVQVDCQSRQPLDEDKGVRNGH